MNQLNFTPRIINEIEDQMKQSIGIVVGNNSVKNLHLLIKKGLKIDDEQAWNEFDSFLEEGHDTFELQMLIVKRLEEQGFLSREVKMSEEILKRVEEAKQQLKALQISGNQEKK